MSDGKGDHRMRTGRRRIVGALAAVSVSLMPGMVGAHARGEWAQPARVARPSVPTVRVCAGPTPVPLPPLPVGYKRYTSRDLPYSVGYPAGWIANGSSTRDPQGHFLYGPTPYDEDAFISLRLHAGILVRGEALPPAIELDTDGYAKVALLDLSRRHATDPSFAYTARRAGTISVDGTRAELIVVAEKQSGYNLIETLAVWVARDEGWQVDANTPTPQKEPLLPTLRLVLGTFRQCA